MYSIIFFLIWKFFLQSTSNYKILHYCYNTIDHLDRQGFSFKSLCPAVRYSIRKIVIAIISENVVDHFSRDTNFRVITRGSQNAKLNVSRMIVKRLLIVMTRNIVYFQSIYITISEFHRGMKDFFFFLRTVLIRLPDSHKNLQTKFNSKED